LCLARAAIGDNVGYGGELPHVRALAAAHFESAGGRSKLDDKGVDILPDELIAEPGPQSPGGRRHRQANISAAPTATMAGTRILRFLPQEGIIVRRQVRPIRLAIRAGDPVAQYFRYRPISLP
jgi:hypothetical protein